MTDHTYDPQAAPQKGSSAWKWCLGIGCALFLLAGIGVGVATVFLGAMWNSIQPVTDPVQVQQRLTGIIASQPPPGYEGVFAFSFPGVFQMAMIGPQGTKQGQNNANAPLMIMVCTIPPGSGPEQMKDKIREAMQKSAAQNGAGGAGGDATQELMVESEDGTTMSRTISVRGEQVSIEQTVGRTKDGQSVKQVLVLVPRSKDSEQMVMIMGVGKADTFDQAAFDAYLESIR